MRSRQLQAALTEFAKEAAARLHADVHTGQEVAFELASHSSRGRRSPTLYHYRPLTGTFIAERFHELRRLNSYPAAAELLQSSSTLDRYLLSRGAETPRRGRGGRVDSALLALLQDVFDEQTDFELRPERLDNALQRLDGSAFAARGEVTLLATLHGLAIASEELPLTRGLLIARPHALNDAPEQAVYADADGGEDHLLVAFTAEDPDAHAAIAEGKDVLRELLRALRLFGDGRVTLGSLAWTRIGACPWNAVALGLGGRPHGMLVVTAEQEDELRAFCSLVSRRSPHASELAWALRRFEMGCERESEYEAISDHLIALRALLACPSDVMGGLRGGEPEEPSNGLLASRIAALCATPERRGALTARMLKAILLEHEVIAGTAVERSSGLALARELSNNLRALLRDVLCGHLPSDLASLADELLLSGEELGKEVLGDGGESSEILHVAV